MAQTTSTAHMWLKVYAVYAMRADLREVFILYMMTALKNLSFLRRHRRNRRNDKFSAVNFEKVDIVLEQTHKHKHTR